MSKFDQKTQLEIAELKGQLAQTQKNTKLLEDHAYPIECPKPLDTVGTLVQIINFLKEMASEAEKQLTEIGETNQLKAAELKGSLKQLKEDIQFIEMRMMPYKFGSTRMSTTQELVQIIHCFKTIATHKQRRLNEF